MEVEGGGFDDSAECGSWGFEGDVDVDLRFGGSIADGKASLSWIWDGENVFDLRFEGPIAEKLLKNDCGFSSRSRGEINIDRS